MSELGMMMCIGRSYRCSMQLQTGLAFADGDFLALAARNQLLRFTIQFDRIATLNPKRSAMMPADSALIA